MHAGMLILCHSTYSSFLQKDGNPYVLGARDLDKEIATHQDILDAARKIKEQAAIEQVKAGRQNHPALATWGKRSLIAFRALTIAHPAGFQLSPPLRP